MALSRKFRLLPYTLLLAALAAHFTLGADNLAPVHPTTQEQAAPMQADGSDAKANNDYLKSKIDPKPFDRETWNKNREGLHYNDKETEAQKAKKEAEYKKKSGDGDKYVESQPYEHNSTPWNLNLGPLAQVILIVGVVLLLALLVFALVKMGLFNPNTQIKKTLDKPTLLGDIEDNLHESDLERALRLALEAKDYRMAIRIYYLSIIKELSLLERIQWKRDKTNGQYVKEMMEQPDGAAFRALTVSFERAWYSDETIVLQHFNALNPQFQSFINSLKKR